MYVCMELEIVLSLPWPGLVTWKYIKEEGREERRREDKGRKVVVRIKKSKQDRRGKDGKRRGE